MQSEALPEHVRWLSVGAAIAAISVVGIAIGLGIPLLSITLESRGYSTSMIGANTAVAGLASIVGAWFAIPIARRFGVINILLTMIVIGALSFLGFYLATDFWMWFPLRVTLHVALTTLFILSEFWISTSAPPAKRGLVLGIYATMLSLGFALGPFLFSQIGSAGFMPYLVTVLIVSLALVPVAIARREEPSLDGGTHGKSASFVPYIFMVPAATAAVLVFGAVETGGFALFPVYGARSGFSEGDAALLLTAIGLGNVILQIPLGILSDRVSDRRVLLAVCAVFGLVGMGILPFVIQSWYLAALVLFFWGGVVAGLYTIGLAHLGSRLSGGDLASANAAFVFCYGFGMLLGPQAIGSSMDLFGVHGFELAIGAFFVLYLLLIIIRVIATGRK
ncbi:MFS transporter [Limoniibacter endophyticus]|uniref:MFS transporter n=2 Tax=Limoniibacter endophyticus TaxID=1565040 RepID=A0A8J3DP39_9HYPH|nr:MFS transporter [Limoniibacter endophyticus]